MARPVLALAPMRTACPSTSSLVDARLVAGRFEVIGPLGAGAHGHILEARDLCGGGLVAIKLATAHGRAALSNEARALERLSRAGCRTAPRLVALLGGEARPSKQPRIPRFAASGEAPGLVMERIDGTPLDTILGRGRLDDAATATLARALLAALAEVHAAGVVHGDLKPSHALLDGRSIRLVDLGLARLDDPTSGSEAPPHPADGIGSPAYLAPERFLGRPPDVATDLYAVGAILFEAIGGRPLIDEDADMTAAMHVHLYEPPPWPRAALSARGATGDAARVAARCLEKDPWRRPATAADALAGVGFARCVRLAAR